MRKIENKYSVVSGVLGILGSIFDKANQAELNRQALLNARYMAELELERDIARNALERKRLDVELKNAEIQVACFSELLKYQQHKFDRCIDILQQQLNFAISYYQTERNALLEQRKLCVEEQIKAYDAIEPKLYTSMTSAIR